MPHTRQQEENPEALPGGEETLADSMTLMLRQITAHQREMSEQLRAQDYLVHFNIVTGLNGWVGATKANMLAANLQGPAVAVLHTIDHIDDFSSLAKLYEAMNEVYKIMILIAEAERNYKKLANIHSKLHDAFSLIEKNQKKRVFGTFYRVAFYGDKFGDLNEYEFIYKEPTLTKLSEIFNRLQTFYQERFGAGNVITIKDSNVVNKNELQADKLYIQITYVEPYFDIHELKSRVSMFEKNFTIRKFMCATPFTPHGRPHGSIAEQWKRKTFLATSHHFPYIKRRIPVVEKDEIVLTPIEVAIEDIQNKTLELAATVAQEPPDAKMLQMVLQGCIGTTVNQGPKEVAVVFLSDLLNENAKPTNFQNKLRLCFKEFAKQCNDGLRKNEKIILAEQLCYQQELEKNFWRFVDYLETLIHIKSVLAQEKSVYLRPDSETEC